MSNNYKISVLFVLISLAITAYFIYFSEKIHIKDNVRLANIENNLEQEDINETEKIKSEFLYLEKIDKIISSLDEFFLSHDTPEESLSIKIEAENKVIDGQANDLKGISLELTEINVPKEYKGFHLDLSRVILTISDKDSLAISAEVFDIYKTSKNKLIEIRERTK